MVHFFKPPILLVNCATFKIVFPAVAKINAVNAKIIIYLMEINAFQYASLMMQVLVKPVIPTII